MTSLPHNNNIHKGPPEIHKLGLYGRLKVALDIPLFGFFDLFDGFRKIRIIWRETILFLFSFLHLLLQKIRKGQQFGLYLLKNARKLLYKLLHFFWIKHKGIDIADYVPKPAILVKRSDCFRGDHGWTFLADLGGHLFQQQPMPVCTLRHTAVYS